MDKNDATVEELIQLQLAMIDAVIQAVGEPHPYHLAHQRRVSDLLSQLREASITPEYAEVELEKLEDELDRWSVEENRRLRDEIPDYPW